MIFLKTGAAERLADAKINKGKIIIPPEWAPQYAIWTAWPFDPYEWDGDLESPRQDVAKLIQTLQEYGNRIKLLVNGKEAESSARDRVGNFAEIIPARYGDIWLRDTGPIFGKVSANPVALRFKTNSWGGKFNLPDDETVGDEIARLSGSPIHQFNFVLEGGAIDHDGEGTILTTRQTLLNKNRNSWTKTEAETALKDALGAEKVIWIDEGIRNDHTDGHIDNIARFIAPGKIVCQQASSPDDPNITVFESIIETLSGATDSKGKKLEIIRIPSVGSFKNKEGQISAASHINFVIANNVVIVPTYETMNSKRALSILQDFFPNRKVLGLSSVGLLGAGNAGGGSFHCITQQQPLLKA